VNLAELLVQVLGPHCENVFPDIAPEGVSTPYIVYQGIGGRSVRYLDMTPADKRNTLMQFAVWSDRRATSSALIGEVEEALCGALAFTAMPQGEPVSLHDPATDRYGSVQRFSIWSGR
jgi:hypothetical protein